MTRAEVRAELTTLANAKLRRDGPLPTVPIAEAFDSMQRLTLVVAIEDHFELCLEPEDEASIVTIEDLIDLILKKKAMT